MLFQNLWICRCVLWTERKMIRETLEWKLKAEVPDINASSRPAPQQFFNSLPGLLEIAADRRNLLY